MKQLMNVIKQHDTPMLIFSEKKFKENYNSLKEMLPQVKHHFALKSLPHPSCIKLIQELDGRLDLATVGEMKLVEKIDTNLFKTSILTHPVKSSADLIYFKEKNISVIVADNKDELQKIIPFKNNFDVLIRIAFSNEEARTDLSKKFGAQEEDIIELIEYALEHGIQVIGCCFHVGSQMNTPHQHISAIKFCFNLYRKVNLLFAYTLRVLDIGGGFPAKYNDTDYTLEEFCQPICEALFNYFPDTEIWSEPGRCIVADTAISVCQVIGKKIKGDTIWYYLNDGLYGLFSANIYDNAYYSPRPFIENQISKTKSILCGPTCDSIDIFHGFHFIPELQIGDYLYCSNMGAYTWASRTDFNHCHQVTWVEHNFENSFIHDEELCFVLN